MKKTKKLLSLLLAVLMVCLSAPAVRLGAFEAKAAEYKQGDVIEFGSYPQSNVTDSALIAELNAQGGAWTSYGYYSGSEDHGSMQPSDYMRYKDVVYGGAKYRGVVFDSYRPYWTVYPSSSGNTYQDDNGYTTGTVYWFKYEPIRWRVLDPDEGLVMCESIIDSQAYSNTTYTHNSEYWNDASHTHYANDYATSSIRNWLKDSFYEIAFTYEEKAKIGTTTLDNSAKPGYPRYDSPSTNDKIFLMSYKEILNPDYGFSSEVAGNTARQMKGTDYAQSQGLQVYRNSSSSLNGNTILGLRSPGSHSYYACGIGPDGWVSIDCRVHNASRGICPAFKFANGIIDETGGGSGDVKPGRTYTAYFGNEQRNYSYNIDDCIEDFPSGRYHAALSNILSAFSCGMYVYSNIAQSYSSFGFDKMKLYHYDDGFAYNTAGCVIGSKRMSNGENLVLITVRGTRSDKASEWLSDLTIKTDWKGKHIGFNIPASEVLNNLRDFLGADPGSLKKTKYVITGHSRGAAVANLLSVRLMEEEGVSAENLYNYNYACPDVVCDFPFKIENYDNIFNLCNRGDIVAHVPGQICSTFTEPGTSWAKYGQTYWFTPEGQSEYLWTGKAHSSELYAHFFEENLAPESFPGGKSDFINLVWGWLSVIFCPVDVEITDSTGKTIASVTGEEVNYYDSEFGNVIILVDGDKKAVFVKGSEPINIKLLGTDSGTMTYSAKEINAITGEVRGEKTFENVALYNGKQMTSAVGGEITAPDVKLLVMDEKGETAEKEVNTDGTEINLKALTCTCLCHNQSPFIKNFIYPIVRFFWKLFKMNPVCSCGERHY